MRFEQNQEEGDHLYRSALDLREIMTPYYPELHDEKKNSPPNFIPREPVRGMGDFEESSGQRRRPVPGGKNHQSQVAP